MSEACYVTPSIFDLGAKNEVPEFVADSESDRTLLVVMQHVISLQILEVCILRCRMMQVVVDHVVEDVTE